MTSPDIPDRNAKTTRAPAPRPALSRRNLARRHSREAALKGLYQWLIAGSDAGEIEAHAHEQEDVDFSQIDKQHYDDLLRGCIEQAADLDACLARHVDRKTTALSPIEHGVLLIGAYELKNCVDIPYKVVINEAVELAKLYGGTDGHKYVNGVLDKVGADLRPEEVQQAREARRPRS